MERHYQSGRENGECRVEFRCAEDHSDRRRLLRRRALCHVRQSLRPAFCFRLAYGKIRRHEWRRRRRNAGGNQSEATGAQRQEVERRRKKRTFRFHKENVRRANRPALRRREIMDRQNYRSHGNAPSHHPGPGGRVPESGRARVQSWGATNMIYTSSLLSICHPERSEGPALRFVILSEAKDLLSRTAFTASVA